MNDNPEYRSDRIEQKRNLLEWLKARPSPENVGNIQNFLCLRRELQLADWKVTGNCWSKSEHRELAIVPAAVIEMESQLAHDLSHHLSLTCTNF